MNRGAAPLTLTFGTACYPHEASQSAALTLLAQQRLDAGTPQELARAA